MNERTILEQRLVTLEGLLGTPGGPLGKSAGPLGVQLRERWSAEHRLLGRLLADSIGDQVTPTIQAWRRRTSEFIERTQHEQPTWMDLDGNEWDAPQVLELLAELQERLDAWSQQGGPSSEEPAP